MPEPTFAKVSDFVTSGEVLGPHHREVARSALLSHFWGQRSAPVGVPPRTVAKVAREITKGGPVITAVTAAARAVKLPSVPSSNEP